MQKKIIPILLTLCLFTLFFQTIQEVQAKDVPKRPVIIGVLLYTSNNLPNFEGFKAGMKEKGYVEGKEVKYLFSGPAENIPGLDTAMAQLLTQQPDLIYAAPTPTALIAQKATKENKIPVVFGPVNDPVIAGLVKEQHLPGGNITGVMLADSDGKRLQWIREFNPQARIVLLPYNPDDVSSVLSLENARKAALVLGFDIQATPVRNHDEITALIANCPSGITAIFLPRDGMIMARVKDFVELSLQKKLILSSTRSDLVEKGALYSYGFDGFEVGKQAARLADLILQGKKPADLPVETAEDFLTINLKTANALGLTIPPHILRQAHKVIRPE